MLVCLPMGLYITPRLSLSGWNRRRGPVSDRLTRAHHSLARKNQQHDGCALSRHLQPEPWPWSKSAPLGPPVFPVGLCVFICVYVCVCVGVCEWVWSDIQCCRPLHVSSVHHSVWWNKVKPTYCKSTRRLFFLEVTLFQTKCCQPRNQRQRCYFWVKK